jgi:hypothetical protein
MVETRAQAQGKPLKKPGAYSTDAYYQERDEGFGDVGVDQEPDAGAVEDREDEEFQVTAEEDRQAGEVATREDMEELPEAELRGAREEAADLKDRPAQGTAREAGGEPVPIVQDDADELEARDAGYTRAD